jgi:hypothetical protein
VLDFVSSITCELLSDHPGRHVPANPPGSSDNLLPFIKSAFTIRVTGREFCYIFDCRPSLALYPSIGWIIP